MPIVIFLSLCNFPLLRITRVVEAGIVHLPGDAGGASSLNRIREQLTGFGFDNPQRTDFRTARRGAVRYILSIFRRCPPVESNGSVWRERIHIDQDTVFTQQTVADQEHGLILRALTFCIKVILAANLRR